MEMVLSNGSMWLSVHDGLMSLRIGNLPTEARLSQCRTFGALLAIYMAQFGYLPSRLAPAFVVALVQGVEVIDDVSWFELFAPEVATRMSSWPRDSCPPLDNPGIQAMLIDILSLMVILIYLSISGFAHNGLFKPGDLATYSVEDTNNLRSQVLEASLLGVPVGTSFDVNSHVQAFKEGFDITIEQSTVNFCSVSVF
jgi:hypothetical protein